MQTQTYHIDADTTTMAGFADMLTNIMKMGGSDGKQVVDMTGLRETIRCGGAVDGGPDGDGAGAGIRRAGRRCAGRLGCGGGERPGRQRDVGLLGGGEAGTEAGAAQGPVEQLVVDSVEKTPTEN